MNFYLKDGLGMQLFAKANWQTHWYHQRW